MAGPTGARRAGELSYHRRVAADDLRGRRLGGFELIEPLGEGSFGSVWRARQVRLDRDVAVKVLDPLVARDPNAARRFEREGRAAASLDHPSIVPVYEAGDDDGLYYLAMRIVDGETLADLIDREAPLPPTRVLELLAPIADALDNAHAAGLIHRDVKPANILIEHGRPYLADFGIAASARELGRYTTGSIGTAEYMSPEQARGDDVDHRSDLYALGCVAHHALTGRSAFARDDIVATLLAHSVDVAPSTGDAALDAFFDRALAKDRDARFDSGAEFVEALSAAMGTGDDGPDTAARGGRRGVIVAVLAALAVVGVAAGVVVVSSDDGSGPDAAPSVEVSTTLEPGSTELAVPGTGTPPPVPADSVAPVAVRDGGSVSVGTTLDLSDPNPHSSLDTSKVLAEWVLPVMYRIDERLDAVPSLATGPPTVDPDDPLRLTWTLHDDRVWDDGSPVTTADIVATFEYLTAPATSAQRTLLYDGVSAVRAIDDTTLEIDLTAPTGAEYLMFSTIHPIIKDATWRGHLADGGTAADFLVDGVTDAAGPYRLASRQNPGEITLGPNDTWTGDPVPTLDRVRFASYVDSDALVEAQRRREVDVIWVDDVAGDELLEAAAIADTTTEAGTSTIAVQLTLNTASEPLRDVRVRQAILHAIDRDSIADTAVGRKTGELADPWNSLIFSPGQQGDGQPFADQYDLDEANRLLDEAGWTRPDDTVFRRRDGQDLALDIVLLNDADGVNTALAIEDDLQAIGIDVTGLPGTTELTNERLNTGDFDLLLQFRLFNSDPVATELSFATNGCPPTVPGCTGVANGVNVGAFSDPTIDELFAQVALVSDPTARATAFAAIDERLLAAVPAVPLYVEPAFTAYADEVVGIEMAPNLGPLTDLVRWGLVDP